MATTKMAIIAALFIVAALPLGSNAQKALSPEGQKLTDALAELHKKPDDSAVQEAYLKVFPHDYGSFLGLFDLDHELYDGYEFIMILPSLAKNHEAEVGRLVVQLARTHTGTQMPRIICTMKR